MPGTPNSPANSPAGMRNALIVIVAIATLVAVIVVVALVVGGSSAPNFTGYWQTPDKTVVLEINAGPNGYRLVGLGQARPKLQEPAGEPRMLAGDVKYQGTTAHLELSLNDAGDEMTVKLSVVEGGPTMGTFTLTRAPGSEKDLKAQIKRQVAKAQETAVKEGIHSLQVGVQSWAVDHADRYPIAGAVADKGAFGQYLDVWPTNPYTGAPMRQGKEPGDYTYVQLDGGASFKLTGHFEGGGSFSVP